MADPVCKLAREVHRMAKSLMAQSEVDGFLVGGASLDPVSFASIVNF